MTDKVVAGIDVSKARLDVHASGENGSFANGWNGFRALHGWLRLGLETGKIFAIAAAFALAACQTTTQQAANKPSLVLPGAGDQFRVIHPRDDTTYGEQITLEADGTAFIRRLSGDRTGTWKTATCAQNSAVAARSCVRVTSNPVPEVSLTYDLFTDGLLVADPSSGPEWRWSYDLSW